MSDLSKEFICPRSKHQPQGHLGRPHTWEEMEVGHSCSYCGSMPAEEFYDFLRRVIEDDDTKVAISPSDKPNKVYCKRPEVKNATQGPIKFFKWHDDPEIRPDNIEALFKEAVKISREKLQVWMDENIPLDSDRKSGRG